jgi:PleD family two-component response regulator
VETVQKLIVIGGTKKPKVLTVDDDDVLTRFIQTILAGEGMRVETLNKPIQILTVVEQFQPDLILLDVMMPGLSGYDVCRMLRATDKWAHLPVLFLTSKSDADGRASAFQAGATDFLSKPVLAPELVARVQAHLGQSGSKRDASDKGSDGLINRKEFIESARSMAQAAKVSGSDLALCLMLIDDMLNLSIVHGMYAAEKVEVALGDLLRVHFKAESLRAKWGDGGFALAVPGESKLTITEAVQKMLDEFCTFTFMSDRQANFKTSFSAGLAGVPGDEVTIESLMNMANTRMSRGRQQNLGTIVSVG